MSEVVLISAVLAFIGWLLQHGHAPYSAVAMPLIAVIVLICAIRLEAGAARQALLRLAGAAAPAPNTGGAA